MNIYIKPRSHFSTDVSFLRNNGDIIWEQLCDHVPEDFFRVAKVADRLPCLQHYSPKMRSRYLRLVLENVRLEGEANHYPTIEKRGHTYRWVNWN